MTQKAGTTTKVLKLLTDFTKNKSSTDPHTNTTNHTIKIKWGQIATHHAVKWSRTWNTHVQDPLTSDLASKHGKGYTIRTLACPRCGHPKETQWMQLRSAKGYRDIHCEACKLHERCTHHMCQCRLIWHQCPLHRVDPAVHKSRKAPTTTQAKAKPQNKLSARRPAPLSHHAPEKRQTNTTGPYVEPVLYQASNIVASTNPPRNDLLVKVRHRHKAMLAARSAKKEPSLGEHQLPEAQTAP